MFKKKAQGPHYWPQVVEKVKTFGLRPEIVSMLNNVNQIVWEQSPPSDNPNAIAYVSSEDKNNDGKIDKIHFVLSKFPPNAADEEINSIVEMVAKTLVHEYGHIEDFDAEKGFPGGEGVAESAERQADSVIQSGMKAISSLKRDTQDFKMIKELQKLANHLDTLGETKIADKLDSLIAKHVKVAETTSRLGRFEHMNTSDALREVGIVGSYRNSLLEDYQSVDLNSPLSATYRLLPLIIRKSIDTTLLGEAGVSNQEQSQAQTVQASEPKVPSDWLKKIQALIWTDRDGDWGPKTREALRRHLTTNQDKLTPPGQTGVNMVMNWGANYDKVEVQGQPKGKTYERNYRGLFNLLSDLNPAVAVTADPKSSQNHARTVADDDLAGRGQSGVEGFDRTRLDTAVRGGPPRMPSSPGGVRSFNSKSDADLTKLASDFSMSNGIKFKR